MIHRHHRKLRVHCTVAELDDEANIMLVSPRWHRWIHDHPTLSYEYGWLVKSWQDPAEVPITRTWPLEPADPRDTASSLFANPQTKEAA